MDRKIVYFALAMSILSCASRGNAFVPRLEEEFSRAYEELQSNFADKYGEAIAERSVNTRNSSGMLCILKMNSKVE